MTIRTRFAPAPTGLMHLGNVRSALINVLFAHQKEGVFVLRIEDTDADRMIDPEGRHILADLAWLGLNPDEGAGTGGPYEPYFQSKRSGFYKDFLEKLIAAGHVYRCFCSIEELEKKRARQIALKQPPRYDRTCVSLTSQDIEQRLAAKKPFIWRFKLDHSATVAIHDLARGNVTYELKNFSDFPLTREDSSFTFIFANCVDDITMKISHVFRGEEHFSNTALQAALYSAFNAPLPVFWHLPLICNSSGKKLSKRDFGFSLNDLRDEGYLPEAILNYLAIIGGSFEHEVMPLAELIRSFNFSGHLATGHIQYDVEKLRWMNHQWIMNLDDTDRVRRCRLFLEKKFPAAAKLSDVDLARLMEPIKRDLVTLAQISDALGFFFESPIIDRAQLEKLGAHRFAPLLSSLITAESNEPAAWSAFATQQCRTANVAPKEFFALLRVILTGKENGPSIKDLTTMLGITTVRHRLASALEKIHHQAGLAAS